MHKIGILLVVLGFLTYVCTCLDHNEIDFSSIIDKIFKKNNVFNEGKIGKLVRQKVITERINKQLKERIKILKAIKYIVPKFTRF